MRLHLALCLWCAADLAAVDAQQSNCITKWMTPGDTLATPDKSSSTDNHVKLPRISNIRAVSFWLNINSVQDAFGWDYILDARPGLSSGWIANKYGRMNIGSNWNVKYYTYENEQASRLWAMPVYDKWVFVYAQADYAFTEEITLLTRYSENEDLAAKVASFTLWDVALTQQQIEQLAGGGKLTVQPINEFVADQADLSASTWPTPDGAFVATIQRGTGSATGNLAAEVGLPACIECHTPGCGETLEAEPTAVVSGSLTLSGISAAGAFASEAVLQDAVARVADVPADAVTITGVRSVQRRRALRRRLEASTVVVDYEVEATNSETVARKLADATPSVFDGAIQSAAAAAGVEATFADVKTEELSAEELSAESADSDEDDASAAKTASVTLIASVTAGICCLAAAAVMVKRALLARRGKKKTPAVVEPELPRGAAVVLAYAQPLASIKERAMVEVAHTAAEKEAVPSGYGGMGVAPESEYGGMGVIAPEPSQEGEYDPEC